MITKQTKFIVSSDILNLDSAIEEHDTIEEATETERIVLVAEDIFDNIDAWDIDADVSRHCIMLAKHLINKYDITA